MSHRNPVAGMASPPPTSAYISTSAPIFDHLKAELRDEMLPAVRSNLPGRLPPRRCP